jgi:hypothetical protein
MEASGNGIGRSVIESLLIWAWSFAAGCGLGLLARAITG